MCRFMNHALPCVFDGPARATNRFAGLSKAMHGGQMRRVITLLAMSALLGACSRSSEVTDAGEPDARQTDMEAMIAPTADASAASDASAADAGVDAGRDVGVDAGAMQTTTEADLAAFFSAHGGRDMFPSTAVNAIETMLRAEDDVVRGDFSSARTRIDALFADMPLSDPVWWRGVRHDDTNVGTPVAYYGLRLLDEIARVGLSGTSTSSEALILTVVLVDCAEGERPTKPDLTEGESVRLTLDPRVLDDDHFFIAVDVDTSATDPIVTVDAVVRPDGMARFSVTDNGPGIPAEEHERVFEAFFRGSTAEGLPGSGIGLNTCRATLQKAGGTIWIQPDTDSGTVVQFEVPVAVKAPVGGTGTPAFSSAATEEAE